MTEKQLVDMRERIKEQCELAVTYAEDGAYYSATRVLRELANDVKAHADRVYAFENVRERGEFGDGATVRHD